MKRFLSAVLFFLMAVSLLASCGMAPEYMDPSIRKALETDKCNGSQYAFYDSNTDAYSFGSEYLDKKLLAKKPADIGLFLSLVTDDSSDISVALLDTKMRELTSAAFPNDSNAKSAISQWAQEQMEYNLLICESLSTKATNTIENGKCIGRDPETGKLDPTLVPSTALAASKDRVKLYVEIISDGFVEKTDTYTSKDYGSYFPVDITLSLEHGRVRLIRADTEEEVAKKSFTAKAPGTIRSDKTQFYLKDDTDVMFWIVEQGMKY